MKQEMLSEAISGIDMDILSECASYSPGCGRIPSDKENNMKQFSIRRKSLLLVLAAMFLMTVLAGAAAYTRWSATMESGMMGLYRPSEQTKKYAEEIGLSALPEKNTVSATDQGITVSLVQTVMDLHGGKAVFRIEGLELEEGQAPWAWWDFTVDGNEVIWGYGASFYDGVALDEQGNATYAKNGKPIPRVGENQKLLLDYQNADGSIEYSIDFVFPENDGRYFGKEMTVTFDGFGIQGERFEDPDIRKATGKWELSWIMQGSTVQPKKWTMDEKIGIWSIHLIEAEIGEYSMVTRYRLGKEYKDMIEYTENNPWIPGVAGVKLKDGSFVPVFGMNGGYDLKGNRITTGAYCLNTILNPEDIEGLYFYNGSELDNNGYRVEKPYYYIPLA